MPAGHLPEGAGPAGVRSGTLVIRPTTRPLLHSPGRLAVVCAVLLGAATPVLVAHGSAGAWATTGVSALLVGWIVAVGELQSARSLLRVEGGRLVHRGVGRERVVAIAGRGGRFLEVEVGRSRAPQFRHVWLLQDASGRSQLTIYAAAWRRSDLEAVGQALAMPITRGATARDVWSMGRRYPGSVPGWLVRARLALLGAAAVVLALFAPAAVAVLAGA